jgi:hypothetical protein
MSTLTALAHALLELADQGATEDVTALLGLGLALEREGDDFISVIINEAAARGMITEGICTAFESPFPPRIH